MKLARLLPKLTGLLLLPCSAQLPDISSVATDLQVPETVTGSPSPGKRVIQSHPDYRETSVRHTLYLPENWTEERSHPVIVEFTGNGPFSNAIGDRCTGKVEDASFGYGLSAGRDYLWVVLPFVDGSGKANTSRWWGTAPEYSPEPTVTYAKKCIPWICKTYQGDADRVILVGFSRGAIACNFIGLHDDEIARLWRAFIPYSHYDGVRQWPYPGSDKDSAITRLKRLGERPQFIISEAGSDETRRYIESTGVEGSFTFGSTGFRNHNDAWILRPSPARKRLRTWLAEVCSP
ncbi:hypothetical protein HAHE_29020 [Haloferula helveola]|uniref:Uncharacterized protein n=1 Tax=Haloferula helveola TaxID=490095 RepID=A0ABN6H5V7_9BACT|nr:hypothetical protein HAHE_29020 [Haloferula helveola]